MERTKIEVEKRKITGKKVKKLRKEGLIPANIFGKELKSISVQVESKLFQKAFKEAGETALVDVKVGSEIYPSLIHNLQRDPKSDSVIHVDFHKVNLKEKVTTSIPVVLEGESPIVKSGEGLILQTIQEVEIECLPADIPQNIVVNSEELTEVGQSVHIKDLKIDKAKIEIKNDPEEVVATVQTAEMKEVVEETPVTPEDVEATAEKGEDEAEGESSEPGEKKEGKEETKVGEKEETPKE